MALVPDPGYPVYRVAVQLAGGTSYALPLREERGFLPDFDAVPDDITGRATLMWLNYPSNPTSATADVAFFEQAAAFAARNEIAIVHDLAYSEVSYDGYLPPSFLQASGARDVGIEVNSLSKSYNMAGWRIGMAVGNPEMIDSLKRLKSNLDSGIPNAIQRMAIAAMEGPQDCIAEHNDIYQRRRDRLVEAVRALGMTVVTPKASLYLWARLSGTNDSEKFAERLLNETGVAVTPGVNFGDNGEGYVRISLTVPDLLLDEGIRRLQEWRWD